MCYLSKKTREGKNRLWVVYDGGVNVVPVSLQEAELKKARYFKVLL
jgi:hypothetical protein